MGLAAGAGIAVWRRRHARRLQALERQRAVGRERARIARDMHDELGSRLTKAGMVARDLESPGAARQLETLRRTLDDMTVTMDELVWAVNRGMTVGTVLANVLCSRSRRSFAGTPMRCELNIPPD